MPRYQADFLVYGTCYVEAADAEAAKAKINDLVGKNADVQLGSRDIVIDDEGSFVSPVFTPQADVTIAYPSDHGNDDEDEEEEEEEGEEGEA